MALSPVFARRASALAAALAWSTLVVQFLVSLQTTAARGGGLGLAIVGYTGYFTIFTNAFAALVFTAGAVAEARRGRVLAFFGRPGVATVALASLVIVGAVYTLLLRGLWSPAGWQKAADVALHDVMPFVLAAHWLWGVPKRGLAWATLGRGLAYPAVYLVYVLIRGALLPRGGVVTRYPYPFIDIDAIGYGPALGSAAAILAAFAAILAALVAAGRWQARRGDEGAR